MRETFSNSVDLAVMNEYDKGAVMWISTVLGHVYHVACRRVVWNRIFRHLSDYVFLVRNSEIQDLWASSFWSKCSKFQLDFKNAAKNSENVFCWLNNCMRIGIVKLSLLRTGYFSSAANVLTSSRKILHVNKRDFFELNFLGIDPWLW